ncbi:MAG: response regulator [Candidatus Omnitrophica bacterium]|nr:response regulator [Candidatus Omnitrophota bacterium]
MPKLKVLLVDDDPVFVEIMKVRLEANNCEICSAVNGQKGVEKVESDSPDIVFLDILMPVLDGMSALEIIRNKHKKLPVFMLTSFSTENRKEEAKRAGATGFIVKDGNIKEEIESILKKIKKDD